MPASEVHNIDCLELMRTLPDKCFQLAIADPPYGGAGNEQIDGGGQIWSAVRPLQAKYPPPDRKAHQARQHKPERPYVQVQKSYPPQQQLNHASGGRFERYEGAGVKCIDWDVAPKQEFFDELFRVAKTVIIWGGNYFPLPATRCFLIWDKKQPEDFSMAMCEYAWTNMDANAKMFRMQPQGNPKDPRFHPTQKPVELYAWVIRNYAKPGDRIFDPMMGSQSSRIAAYKLGFDYVGCELDKEYFAKGCERFDRECHGITIGENGQRYQQTNIFDNN